MKSWWRRVLEVLGIMDTLLSFPDMVRRLFYVVFLLVVIVSTGYTWISELPPWAIPIVLMLAVGACAVSVVLVGTAWDWWKDRKESEEQGPSNIALTPSVLVEPLDEGEYIHFLPVMTEDEGRETVLQLHRHFTVTNNAAEPTRIQEATVEIVDRRNPAKPTKVEPLMPPDVTLVSVLKNEERPVLPARDSIEVEAEAIVKYPEWVHRHGRENFSVRMVVEAAGEAPATIEIQPEIPAKEASLTWLDLRQEFLSLEEPLNGAWVDVQEGPDLDRWWLRTPVDAKPEEKDSLNSVVAMAEHKLARENGYEREFWPGKLWFKKIGEYSGDLELASVPFVRNAETDELVVTRQVLAQVVSLSAAFCLHLAGQR